MNIIQFFENFFGFGKKPTTPATPSEFQGAINAVGVAMDQAENILNTLQGAAAFLPAAFQGYVAAFAIAVHGTDSYVDTLESPPAAVTPPVTSTTP
jgi:hypothetical protein